MHYHKTDFNLIGHYCNFGRYPSPVIPIGQTQDAGTVLVRYRDGEPDLVPCDKNFVHHDPVLRDGLSGFHYQTHRLLAVSERQVVSYPVNEQAAFFMGFLQDDQFSAENPFFRLDLARKTQDFVLICHELIQCEHYIQSRTPVLLPVWRLEEGIRTLSMLRFNREEDGRFALDLQQHQALTRLIAQLPSAFSNFKSQVDALRGEAFQVEELKERISDMQAEIDRLQKLQLSFLSNS